MSFAKCHATKERKSTIAGKNLHALPPKYYHSALKEHAGRCTMTSHDVDMAETHRGTNSAVIYDCRDTFHIHLRKKEYNSFGYHGFHDKDPEESP